MQPNAFNPMQYTAFHQVRFYDTTLWCSIPEDVHAVSVQPNAFYPVQYTAFHQVRFYDTTLLCSIPEDVHAVSVQPNARAIHCIPSGQIL